VIVVGDAKKFLPALQKEFPQVRSDSSGRAGFEQREPEKNCQQELKPLFSL